jgi:hypothetical protein
MILVSMSGTALLGGGEDSDINARRRVEIFRKLVSAKHFGVLRQSVTRKLIEQIPQTYETGCKTYLYHKIKNVSKASHLCQRTLKPIKEIS